MRKGAWLSLVPVSDDTPQVESSILSPSAASTSFCFIKPPTLARRVATSNCGAPQHARRTRLLPLLPMLACDGEGIPPQPAFDLRQMQVADVEKVQNLHLATLPVTYSASYFYSLLSSPTHLCVLATLPSNPPTSPRPDRSPTRHPNHCTSLLSGRIRVSRDLIGCVSARLDFDRTGREPGVRILTLCVGKEYRRTGVAGKLVDTVVEELAPLAMGCGFNVAGKKERGRIKVKLHVQATNVVAKRFYERQGFKAKLLKRGFYCGMDLKPLEAELRGQGDGGSRPATPKTWGSERDVDAWLMEREWER